MKGSEKTYFQCECMFDGLIYFGLIIQIYSEHMWGTNVMLQVWHLAGHLHKKYKGKINYYFFCIIIFIFKMIILGSIIIQFLRKTIIVLTNLNVGLPQRSCCLFPLNFGLRKMHPFARASITPGPSTGSPKPMNNCESSICNNFIANKCVSYRISLYN